MSTPIELITGLGNPGPKYASTRHNAGFWLLDRLAVRGGAVFKTESRFHADTARIELGGSSCILLKPGTYMNRSGQAVGALCRYYRIPVDRILVVHDEIDLDPGVLRLKRGGGHGGHNGLRDIVAVLGSPDFWRLRIGVGHPGHKDDVVDYVLRSAPPEEQGAIDDAIESALDAMAPIVAGESERVMNQLHRRNTS